MTSQWPWENGMFRKSQAAQYRTSPSLSEGRRSMLEKVTKSDAEWRRLLTPEQYRITREKGTERPWSGRYHDFNGTGVYLCVCCGSRLFSSREKYAVPGKWPTFWAPIAPRNVKTRREI
ncbi:MAG: hypothetical protein HGB21_17820, partial [Nitrospirae bacterium]|nr:hypothetical protein [Nitrospirota bacterium]